MSDSSFLRDGLFVLNKEDLIVSLNETLFNRLGLIRHPDKFEKAFWSEYTIVNGRYSDGHFDIRFALGYSWMRVRANPKDGENGGWYWQDDKIYSFYDNSDYGIRTNFEQLSELLLNANCVRNKHWT